jgi:glycerol-3-phosphate dehydrogenase
MEQMHFSHGLYEKEVAYLVEHEWAMNVEDILWRRTKLGLQFSSRDTKKLQAWFENTSYRIENK